MQDTCEIHWDTCILRGNQDTCGIHVGYMRDTCGIHAGHVSRGFGGMYRCHHGEQRTYQATHVLLVQKWVCSSSLQLLHLLLCHGHPYPCWSTALVEREAQQLFLLHCKDRVGPLLPLGNFSMFPSPLDHVNLIDIDHPQLTLTGLMPIALKVGSGAAITWVSHMPFPHPSFEGLEQCLAFLHTPQVSYAYWKPHFGGVGARSGSHHFCLRSAERSTVSARDTVTSVEDPSALLQVLARDTAKPRAHGCCGSHCARARRDQRSR